MIFLAKKGAISRTPGVGEGGEDIAQVGSMPENVLLES